MLVVVESKEDKIRISDKSLETREDTVTESGLGRKGGRKRPA